MSQSREGKGDIDTSKLSIEHAQELLEDAKIKITDCSDFRYKYDKKCDALDKLRKIVSELEKELLSKEGYNKMEGLLKMAIKIEVANATRCALNDIVYGKCSFRRHRAYYPTDGPYES